jgi:C1A family cysteine protease
MDHGFQYIMESHPLALEADYPYTAQDGTCNQEEQRQASGSIKGFEDVPVNSVSQLKAALMKNPVSIAIEADSDAVFHYKSGVIDKNAGCGQQLDHGVLAVGYGDGYFIVKNSWGSSWGDSGYFKISDDDSNVCGILSNPSYPTA